MPTSTPASRPPASASGSSRWTHAASTTSGCTSLITAVPPGPGYGSFRCVLCHAAGCSWLLMQRPLEPLSPVVLRGGRARGACRGSECRWPRWTRPSSALRTRRCAYPLPRAHQTPPNLLAVLGLCHFPAIIKKVPPRPQPLGLFCVLAIFIITCSPLLVLAAAAASEPVVVSTSSSQVQHIQLAFNVLDWRCRELGFLQVTMASPACVVNPSEERRDRAQSIHELVVVDPCG